MAQNEQQNEKQFVVHRIYTKDVSYESPNSPDIFRQEWKREFAADAFEVVLSVTVTTKIADKTALIAEVHLAGLFGVRGFREPELGPLLGAYCPNLLFPYAREVVSDLVAKGSFPQLVLQPVNFDALFVQHQRTAGQVKGEPDVITH